MLTKSPDAHEDGYWAAQSAVEAAAFQVLDPAADNSPDAGYYYPPTKVKPCRDPKELMIRVAEAVGEQLRQLDERWPRQIAPATAKRWARVEPPELPELMKPDGAGYMPLYCAAQWIAQRGGTQIINPLDEAIWREAFKDLLDRIASGDVKVVGVRDSVTEPEHISGIHFASCPVHYPFSDLRWDLIFSDEICLVSRPYIDDKHWRGRFNDCLEDRRGVRWRRLMVLKADVARCWPFAIAAFGTVPGRDAASDEERQVINHAASILKKNPNAKRDDVRSNCQDRFSGLSKRRFDRLWPEARAEAGLSRRAPSGPKPNAGYPRKFPSLLPRAIRRT